MVGHARWGRRRPGRLSQARPRTLTRSAFSIALSVVVALPVIGLAAAPAYGQETLAEIEEQIDEAWRELEPIIEEHNGIRIELEEKEDEADELADKIEPLEEQVESARAEVTEIAIYNFKGGNVTAVKALLTTGSPLTFVDQVAALDQFARTQEVKIAEVVETKERYEAEKEDLDALVSELSAMEEDLAERADEIDAEIDELQEMRDEAEASFGPTDTGGSTSGACPSANPGGAAGTAVTFACSQTGKPYGWGSAGPGSYDCSGLMLAAWGQAGVSLPHNAAAQRDATRYIDRSELRPGDLVFYYSGLSHVGMYIGDGSIVHASQAGVPIGVSPMDRMPIHSYGRPG